MKSRGLLLLSLFLGFSALSQSSSIDLTFTAANITTHVQLDSIKIMNRTQGGDTILYWPDTVLSLYFTDVQEFEQMESAFKVYQNYPNPVKDQTLISIYVPERDLVRILVFDLLGRKSFGSDQVLEQGIHTYMLIPGKSAICFFNAQWQGNSRSIKILVNNSNNNQVDIQYVSHDHSSGPLKMSSAAGSFDFSAGDELFCIGYEDGVECGISDKPEQSENYTFHFVTNIPCPGTPEVEYEGQVYHTIQIFNQCWFKENLNVGTYPTYGDQSDNGIIEKYCYLSEDSCAKYGGIYQWHEAMQYSTQEGTQGICPPGWHLPTVSDWKILEGEADSLYGIGDPVWEWNVTWKGYNAGNNLKTAYGWHYDNHGIDLYGFSALPAGLRYLNGLYNESVGDRGYWWTSSPGGTSQEGQYFEMEDYVYQVGNGEAFQRYGMSVRCIKGEVYENPIELIFTAIHGYAHTWLDSVLIINLTTQGNEITLISPDTTLFLGQDLLFNYGDELLIIGYSADLQSAIQDYPDENDTIVFQFATNIPCPGTPVVEYEGHTYTTRQIYNHCWLTENLNVGFMISGDQEMADNGFIEKYCYNNELDSCYKYGGLYQWQEMMEYDNKERARGICPPGWHIPSDLEWKILEGSIDSLYRILDPEWDIAGFRGYDAGKKLKSTYGWFDNANGTDIFGFSGMPAGSFDSYGNTFDYITKSGCWWTSTEYDYGSAWSRILWYQENGINRDEYLYTSKDYGLGVRCLKDQ